MIASEEYNIPLQNRILATLPKEEYDLLIQHLDPFRLDYCYIISEIGDNIEHVYFPTKGMISLLSVTQDGSIIEVGMVGDEGAVGIPIALGVNKSPYRTMVQVQGSALRIKSCIFNEEFDSSTVLRDLLLVYTYTLLTQVSQSAVCNRFHNIKQRLCRWLLLTKDRVNSNEFKLTHNLLSHMLGTRREGVTVAIAALQNKRLIRHQRGHITILDIKGIQAMSCECYNVTRELSIQALRT